MHSAMEKIEYNKLMPIVNPRLYRMYLNKKAGIVKNPGGRRKRAN